MQARLLRLSCVTRGDTRVTRTGIFWCSEVFPHYFFSHFISFSPRFLELTRGSRENKCAFGKSSLKNSKSSNQKLAKRAHSPAGLSSTLAWKFCTHGTRSQALSPKGVIFPVEVELSREKNWRRHGNTIPGSHSKSWQQIWATIYLEILSRDFHHLKSLWFNHLRNIPWWNRKLVYFNNLFGSWVELISFLIQYDRIKKQYLL